MRNPSSPLSAVSAGYVQELEARYRRDPDSIDPGWRCVLDVLHELETDGGPRSNASLEALIASVFREQGHLEADLDPLGIRPRPTGSPIAAALERFYLPGADTALIERFRSIYCGSLAVESGHIDVAAVREWIRSAFEDTSWVRSPERDRVTLERLITAEQFERFMGVKFPGRKRFGAEGAEALIPLLDRLLHNAAASDVTDVVIGTMHRGRLNASANVFGKPLETLLAQFKGMHPFAMDSPATADVPYHLGHEAELVVGDRKLRLTLLPNPSHLEAVNPVVLGRVRARQTSLGDPGRVLGVILHTDASVVAQGLVAEMLQLSQLDGFTTGGTVHVIINNQIGFTTERHEARTSYHCTGQWKAIDSLILHANGDDPDAAVRAADVAFNFRQANGRDAVIDLVCYRRNGHNEVDEPRFTQPVAYRTIDQHPSVVTQFAVRLVEEGTVSSAQVETLIRQTRDRLEHAFESAAADPTHREAVGRIGPGAGPGAGDALGARPVEPETGLPIERLTELMAVVSSVPVEMKVNQKVGRIVSQRARTLETGVPWAVSEALAFASLLAEGTSVRLSGQDSVRGVFSQRHLALVDAETATRHIPLESLAAVGARFEVVNSLLSEYAVLGFEYGYSVECPEALVLWEAQFGDFANGAQIMIDQFIASGEEKWRQSSGLVMLLPHGLEGQGPEHSSGRVERLLQLCAQENLRIAQPSTPANYFHLLRRQIRLQARKPLLILTPKSLLRHPAAVSALAEFGPGTAFQTVIAASSGAKIRHVLLCSGKVAYDLERDRDVRGLTDVAIVRLESLYPFPAGRLGELFKQWPAARYTWVQEEPRNLGAWSFVDRRLEAVLEQSGARHTRVACVSRPESASPAGSFHGSHDRDQRLLIEQAFSRAADSAGKP